MSRTYTQFSTPDTAKLLDVLIDAGTSPTEYRAAMTRLGERMAKNVLSFKRAAPLGTVCVICTVEDADFLARGVVDGLLAEGLSKDRVKLVCFWNERIRRFDGDREDSFDVAPIIKEYREDVDVQHSLLIVVKSIISGSCVVRTNIATLIDRNLPERVIVAAPVMLKGAPDRLANEFPPAIAERFSYVTFAIDDEKGPDDNVIPGIGGSVYERLGFEDKNAYVPELVKQRRKELAHN